jgi:hypothetical protein
MGRSGDEPVNARSPLRLRLGLAGVGLLFALAGATIGVAHGSTAVVLLFAAVAVVAAINLVVVARHVRQGPHYQPGRDVPAYRPLPPLPSPSRRPPPIAHPERIYLALMGLCLVLITVSWVWLPRVNRTAALAVGAVAALIPPIAVVIANANWNRGERRPPDEDRDGGGGRST